MNKSHMKIASLVILLILLAVLTAWLARAAIINMQQQEIEFSGTFVQLPVKHYHHA